MDRTAPYYRFTFSNKARAFIIPRDDTASVTVLVLVGVGSRHEPVRFNGIAHFTEHMMFKGTRRRPTTLALSRELDRVGADYNAYTGKEYTGYYIKADARHTDLAFDILSDMLLHSLLDSRELDRERGVIEEEIKMYHDNPLMHAPDLFEKALYGTTNLGRPIAGTPRSLARIDRAAIRAFMRRHYHGSNIVIAVAGNLQGKSPEHVARSIEQRFAFSITARSQSRAANVRGGEGSPVVYESRETQQAQVIIGVPAYPYRHRLRAPLTVLSVILGGNMSSRLFIRVRERLGLAYFVRSDVSSYQDTGSFSVHAGVDPRKTQRAVRAIMKELGRVAEKGVRKQELEDAQEYIRGKISLSLEDSAEIASWYARQELLAGAVETPQQRMRRIERVTWDDIQRVARQLFFRRSFHVSLIGPFDEKFVQEMALGVHGRRFM